MLHTGTGKSGDGTSNLHPLEMSYYPEGIALACENCQQNECSPLIFLAVFIYIWYILISLILDRVPIVHSSYVKFLAVLLQTLTPVRLAVIL